MAVAVPERGWKVGNTSGSGKSGVVSAPHISGMWNRSLSKGAAVVIYRAWTRGGRLRHVAVRLP